MLQFPNESVDFIKTRLEDGILFVELAHPKKTNPFSRKMTIALRDLALRVNSDPEIRGILLSGGKDRSFSVGGDFEDVSKLSERVQIRNYLLEIVDLYTALLSIEVPVVASIDHFAIGQGLQVSMTADWRIGSKRSQLQMPELKNGVACPLGSTLLESFLGRAEMLKLVVGCGSLDAPEALSLGLLSQVVDPVALEQVSLEKIRELASYPSIPFRNTKRFYNAPLIEKMNLSRDASAEAHIQSFLQRAGAAHFDKILSKK